MQQMIAEYAKRMGPIHKVELIELPNSAKKDTDVGAIIDDESSRILSKVGPQEFVVLLDLQGKDVSSVEMSAIVMNEIDLSHTITFVIGGSHGVNQAVRTRSNFRWHISNLTFPHQLVRVLLYEQLYRFFMIAKNHPYHK